ncbi:uncharacterized protein BJ171DRAFT_196694 [Polychytrium aggregatum]|uniref:uncharacterized protein n=1 Tax=Polychytrium aggregatum TaxID=110093 RepID=UPI0022FE0B65|nr:uncharacterized protein BJ171DRAFT_196694 [Polychytrium aggregatum]KAI9201856.1 hypothetical protein BJ171DRAFT_196694 [Polychytrium aggregatum]
MIPQHDSAAYSPGVIPTFLVPLIIAVVALMACICFHYLRRIHRGDVDVGRYKPSAPPAVVHISPPQLDEYHQSVAGLQRQGPVPKSPVSRPEPVANIETTRAVNPCLKLSRAGTEPVRGSSENQVKFMLPPTSTLTRRPPAIPLPPRPSSPCSVSTSPPCSPVLTSAARVSAEPISKRLTYPLSTPEYKTSALHSSSLLGSKEAADIVRFYEDIPSLSSRHPSQRYTRHSSMMSTLSADDTEPGHQSWGTSKFRSQPPFPSLTLPSLGRARISRPLTHYHSLPHLPSVLYDSETGLLNELERIITTFSQSTEARTLRSFGTLDSEEMRRHSGAADSCCSSHLEVRTQKSSRFLSELYEDLRNTLSADEQRETLVQTNPDWRQVSVRADSVDMQSIKSNAGHLTEGSDG